jgi:hypothetical protein
VSGTDEGSLSFTCGRTRGHPHGGVHSRLYVPQPDGLPGIEGYAAELGLGTELPRAIAHYRGKWIEYGVARASLGDRRPSRSNADASWTNPHSPTRTSRQRLRLR